MKTPAQQDVSESQIAAVLQHRYGDGMVYVPRHRTETLYSMAQQHGFIDSEGYLTRKGRALIARYQ